MTQVVVSPCPERPTLIRTLHYETLSFQTAPHLSVSRTFHHTELLACPPPTSFPVIHYTHYTLPLPLLFTLNHVPHTCHSPQRPRHACPLLSTALNRTIHIIIFSDTSLLFNFKYTHWSVSLPLTKNQHIPPPFTVHLEPSTPGCFPPH